MNFLRLLKKETKGRAFALCGGDSKPKSVCFTDGIHDVQADTKTAFVAVGTLVTFRDTF